MVYESRGKVAKGMIRYRLVVVQVQKRNRMRAPANEPFLVALLRYAVIRSTANLAPTAIGFEAVHQAGNTTKAEAISCMSLGKDKGRDGMAKINV